MIRDSFMQLHVHLRLFRFCVKKKGPSSDKEEYVDWQANSGRQGA